MRRLIIIIGVAVGIIACSPSSNSEQRYNIPTSTYNVIDSYSVRTQAEGSRNWSYTVLSRVYIDGCIYILAVNYLDSELIHAANCENHE